MNRKLLLASLATALSGAMGLVGCGSSTTGTVKSCATDNDCGSKEVCLPGAKICVPTCEKDSDCTSNYCMTVSGMTAMVCGCTSSSECGSETCHTVDKVCEPKCTADTDCADYTPTRTCNASLGQCNVGGCSPACTGGKVCAGGVCVTPAQCTTTNDCQSTLPACVGGACAACTTDTQCNGRSDGKTRCSAGECVIPLVSCDSANHTPGSNGGPDVCNYGEDCVSNRCEGVPNNPQCSGFQNYPFVWDPETPPYGPVILSAVGHGYNSSNSSTECGDGGPKTEITITFYAPSGWTHGDLGDIIDNRITIIKGTGATVRTAFARGYPPSGGTSGTFVAGSCGTSDFSNRAVFMTDASGTAGNIICIQ